MLRLLKKLQKITGIAIACVLVLVTALALAFTKKNDNEILKLSHFDSDIVTLDNETMTITYTPKSFEDLGVISGRKFKKVNIEDKIVKTRAVGWKLEGEPERIIGTKYKYNTMPLVYKKGKRTKRYNIKVDYRNFTFVYGTAVREGTHGFKTADGISPDGSYNSEKDSFICFLRKSDIEGKSNEEVIEIIRANTGFSADEFKQKTFFVNNDLEALGVGQKIKKDMFKTADDLRNVAVITLGEGVREFHFTFYQEGVNGDFDLQITYPKVSEDGLFFADGETPKFELDGTVDPEFKGFKKIVLTSDEVLAPNQKTFTLQSKNNKQYRKTATVKFADTAGMNTLEDPIIGDMPNDIKTRFGATFDIPKVDGIKRENYKITGWKKSGEEKTGKYTISLADVPSEDNDIVFNLNSELKRGDEAKVKILLYTEKKGTGINTEKSAFKATDFDEIEIIENNKVAKEKFVAEVANYQTKLADHYVYDFLEGNTNVENVNQITVKGNGPDKKDIEKNVIKLYFVYKRKTINLNCYYENAENDSSVAEPLENITARYCDEFTKEVKKEGFQDKTLVYNMKEEYAPNDFANLSNGATLNPSLNNKGKFTILRKRVKVEFNLNQPRSQDGTTTKGTAPSNGEVEVKYGQLIKNWPTKTSFTHRDYDFLSTDKKIGSNSENILSDVKEYKISITDVNFDKITFNLNWKNKTEVKYHIRIYIENEVFNTGKKYNTGEGYKKDMEYSTDEFSFFDSGSYTNGTANETKSISQSDYFNDKVFSKRSKYLKNKATDTGFVGTENDFLHFLHENSNLSQKKLLIKGDGSTEFNIYYVRNRYKVYQRHFIEDVADDSNGNHTYSELSDNNWQAIGGGAGGYDEYFTCKSRVPFRSEYLEGKNPGFEIFDKDTFNHDEYMGFNLVMAYIQKSDVIINAEDKNTVVSKVSAGNIGEAKIRYANNWYGKVKRKRVKMYVHNPKMLPYKYKHEIFEYGRTYRNTMLINKFFIANIAKMEITGYYGEKYFDHKAYNASDELYKTVITNHGKVHTFKYGYEIQYPKRFWIAFSGDNSSASVGFNGYNIFGRITDEAREFKIRSLLKDKYAAPYFKTKKYQSILIDKKIVNYILPDGSRSEFTDKGEPNGVRYILWFYFMFL